MEQLLKELLKSYDMLKNSQRYSYDRGKRN